MTRKPSRPDRGQLQAEFILSNAALFRDPGKLARTETTRPTVSVGTAATGVLATKPVQKTLFEAADAT